MSFLILSRDGWENFRATGCSKEESVWISGDVLSDEELAHFRNLGWKITNFSHPITSGDPKALEQAVATIGQHHPGKPVWVEFCSDS